MQVGPISISSQKNWSDPAEICLLQFFLVIGSKFLKIKYNNEINEILQTNNDLFSKSNLKHWWYRSLICPCKSFLFHRSFGKVFILFRPHILWIFVHYLLLIQRVQAAEIATAQVFCDNIFPQLSFLIPIFVALSCFGGINGSLFASGRIFYVAGKKGHLPPFLSMVSIGANTPAPAGHRLEIKLKSLVKLKYFEEKFWLFEI